MKKILLITALVFNIYFARGQRFFYLESDDASGNLIKEGLVKSSQFVTRTPLASDYIIKTEIGFQKEPNKLTLQIILEDSITFKTIYQTNEEYNFGIINQNSKLLLRTALETFIEKNISQIILCARDDHYDTRMKPLKPKKDKT
ncbi:MAG TPA: hypothetical protein VNX68_06195 [Nitrosopumilaceae archaeon]|jgi:hypothetical protein|nr:hypothetical protein [Nitrosopumilaceae archaeon]